jgi:putative DNA methylase
VTETPRKRKLIEVALPLDEINAACKADKDRKTGTIRNLHKWFAPMPLPAWRALLFATLIDAPGNEADRAQLLDIIKRLVKHGADLPDNADLAEATQVLSEAWNGETPVVMDPFCGGGSTLVEAQRLGIQSLGSDLNPVPALVSRTLTELLPAQHGLPPTHPPESHTQALFGHSSVAQDYEGLAEDFRYYATGVLDKVRETTKENYPLRQGENPVAWIWARTARCVNPACGIRTVLVTTWWLSKKPGDLAWIEHTVADGQVHLRVVGNQASGSPPEPPKAPRGTTFQCLACGSLVSDSQLIEQGRRGEIGYRLLAVAATVDGRRVYRDPLPGEESTALAVRIPDDLPNVAQSDDTRSFSGPRYGFPNFTDLFMPRQLATLSAFADETARLYATLLMGGTNEARATAIVTLLGLAVGQLALVGSTETRWRLRVAAHAKAEGAFSRNDLRLNWDFAETYFASASVGDWLETVNSMIRAFEYAAHGVGKVLKADARVARADRPALVATDPPYFDAIDYADLSDFFYIWHRRALRGIHPDLYSTVATPKSGELIASARRHHNDKDAAREYFVEGFTQTFGNLSRSLHPDLPLVVVYASKEQRAGDEETRWSAILTAILAAGLEVTSTWPIHGTGSSRMIGIGANAVASYIVMTCRPRPSGAGATSLNEFARTLRRELGPAVRDLQSSSILPIDLAQAAMGPGMQIFSRYREILDQNGRRVPVEQALRLINQALSEILDEQEGELDPESRFAVRWWEQHHWEPGPFGDADKAARPLGIAVEDVVAAQIAAADVGTVRLAGRGSLNRDWQPAADSRPTAWEAVHHLADRLIDGGGELDAARLMADLGDFRDSAMALVYRLHDIAARRGWTDDQERYNALIHSWADLVKLGASQSAAERLF